MPDNRLIKQVVFGIMDDKKKEEDRKKMDIRLSELVQQGYRYPLQIGDGQNEMDTFREKCHEHQRALSPRRKRERERAGQTTRNFMDLWFSGRARWYPC